VNSMGIRVLLADDHAVVRDGLRVLLESKGGFIVVGDAATGREAVLKTMKLKPDVVVMDIAMPDLNGIEAAREIRERRDAAQVIILSMHGSTEHIYRALQAGAKGFVLKESAGSDVVKAIRAVHGGRRYLSQQVSEKMAEDYIRLRKSSSWKSPLEKLSLREREVLQLVAEGKTSAEIAAMLNLSPKSVDTYRSRLMQKLGISDMAGLIKFAIQHGITPL
jgi:DNA-binding NarL/FixJ family response regulator